MHKRWQSRATGWQPELCLCHCPKSLLHKLCRHKSLGDSATQMESGVSGKSGSFGLPRCMASQTEEGPLVLPLSAMMGRGWKPSEELQATGRISELETHN